MKKLFVILLLIPSLSWGLDLRDILEETNTSLLTFGVFKINYELNSNYDEILKDTKSTMQNYSLTHFKKNVDLDNKMPGESLDVSSIVRDIFRVWDFNNKLKLNANIDNEKDRLLITYKVQYIISPFEFDKEIKENKLKRSKSSFFDDFDSLTFLNSFDSKTICRILRVNIQSALGFYPPSEIYNSEKNDFKIITNHSADNWKYKSFINEYFSNEGRIWKDSIFKDHKPLKVDINVLAENIFKEEKILCHGDVADFNPSIVEYDIYTDEWESGLHTK